jgi:hypothetical protein
MRPSARARTFAGALLLVGAALFPLAIEGHAFSSGPPPGYTNAPGEANCTICHSSFALDSGAANFTISVPQSYTPNSTNPVQVSFGPLSTSTPRHGFQITARNGDDVYVGGWQVVQTGLTKNAQGSTFHHEHTLAGVALESWHMNWIAPASLPNGPVTFHACGNEANNAQGPFGDRIYSTKAKMYQAIVTTPEEGWAIGATHLVHLATSAAHAGEIAFIVPSDDPTPVSLGGPFELEVNPYSGFYAFALGQPQVFQNLTSTLDASGHTTASVAVPNIPQLIGMPLHFAAITTDAALNPTEVSNRLSLKLK